MLHAQIILNVRIINQTSIFEVYLFSINSISINLTSFFHSFLHLLLDIYI